MSIDMDAQVERKRDNQDHIRELSELARTFTLRAIEITDGIG